MQFYGTCASKGHTVISSACVRMQTGVDMEGAYDREFLVDCQTAKFNSPPNFPALTSGKYPAVSMGLHLFSMLVIPVCA